MTTIKPPFYDHKSEQWYTKLLLRFLKSIDLSENLVKAQHALGTIPNGTVSLFLLPFALLITLGVGLLAYYFDLYASWQAVQPLGAVVNEALPIGTGLAWVVMTLTLLPTAAEMLGARFSQFDIVPIQATTWVLVVVDLLTNIPTINEVTAPYQGVFYAQEMNPVRWALGYVAYGIMWTLSLFVSAYFLEVVTVILAFTTGYLFHKSAIYFLRQYLSKEVGLPPRTVTSVADDFDSDFSSPPPHPSRGTTSSTGFASNSGSGGSSRGSGPPKR